MALVTLQAQAQGVGSLAVPSTDEEVIRAWQAANPGAAAPMLQADGQGTRIVWAGGVAVDAYRNEVKSGSGYVGTPMTTGNFGKATTQGDLRATRADGTVDYLLFNTVHTDDRSVLARSAYQVGNLQFGRSASTYSIAGGDVAPNFSPLSSALGVRGVLGQLNVGQASVTAFTGRVAESWEALTRSRLRTQPVSTVHGAKVEVPLTDALHVYATTQQYTQRYAASAATPGIASARIDSTNSTAGLQYALGNFTLSAEGGSSRLDDPVYGDQSGSAGVIDGAWRFESATVRVGVHSIDPGYTSLSQAARPGIEEAYAAAEWAAVSWLSLGADLRRTRNTTLANAYYASLTSETDSAALNGNINFGTDWPGWTLAVQRAVSQSRAPVDQHQANHAGNLGLNYASPQWNLNLTRTRNRVENSSFPGGDSTTDGWQGSIGHAFGVPPESRWTGTAGINAKTQIQRMASGLRAESAELGLQLSAERANWASFNLLAVFGSLSEAQDLPSVRTRALQADVGVPLLPWAKLKVYARYAVRRGADPILELVEKTLGLQLSANF